MKCLECGTETTPSRMPYVYEPNGIAVRLINVLRRDCRSCGAYEIVIPNQTLREIVDYIESKPTKTDHDLAFLKTHPDTPI